MRQVPDAMDAAWLAGDFTGDNHCMGRVTVQHLDMRLFDVKYNLYASFVFGTEKHPPKELPNVKSIKWSRGVDSDIATGTIEFYNTSPQPLGTVFHPEFGIDNPGYYTFNRGKTVFTSRWGDTPNEWAGLLVPDNVLRTYEGYGFNATVCPDKDEHLVQTGTWIITEVDLTAKGIITCTVEDFAAILRDQICFYPVIPKKFYPLTFTAEPKKSGFADGFTHSTTSTPLPAAGYRVPAGWTGPVAAPTAVSVVAGNGRITVHWSPPAAPPAGYKIDGYETYVDNVHVGPAQTASGRSAVLSTGIITNGVVYLGEVAAVYQQISTGKTVAGERAGLLVHPFSNPLPTVTPGSISLNTGPPSTDPTAATVPLLGTLKFHGSSIGGFTVIRYDGTHHDVWEVPGNTGGDVYLATGQGSLTGADFLIHGHDFIGGIGPGEMFSSNGRYFMPPTGSKEPLPPGIPAGPTITTKTGVTKPLVPVRLQLSYDDNSNGYYVGHGGEVSVYGHEPDQAIDGDSSTYWLSIGNERNDQGYSYEWWQGSLGDVNLTEVVITTAKANYFVWVSVFANGAWVHRNLTDIIPYDPLNPQSHNGGNIPYFATAALGASEGPYRITLPTLVTKATKVRVTFHNLQNFGVGAEPYRAGLKEIACYGALTSTAPLPPGAQPIKDGGGDGKSTSATKYVPPKETPGAGMQPGYYEDYTDIVKLMCAWGGLYWPYGASRKSCDGSLTTYGFGPNVFGLHHNDPVLGDQAAGRVWGDFATTGTAGIAALPIAQWDKKSLLDGINYVREIIGFIFYIDEEGAAVWRLPNWFTIGNYVGDRAYGASRVSTIVVIDETQTLIDLTAKLSSRNVRERYFIAGTDGKTGALAKGFNPNPTGLRRVGGWTDQHFGTNAECQIMADLIALRALMAYRKDTIEIVGYPRIQIDDQVQIIERTTGEGYVHYVEGISSNNDIENGAWTYSLNTQWLGENPFDKWAFDPAYLSAELRSYLDAAQVLGLGAFAPPPSKG